MWLKIPFVVMAVDEFQPSEKTKETLMSSSW